MSCKSTLEVKFVKIIMRFRWILVAILVAILYYWNRKGFDSLLAATPVWFFVALLFVMGLSGQLDRIERKLDAMATHESGADRLHSDH